MSLVIKIIGVASGTYSKYDDAYIKEFHPDIDPLGHGQLVVTRSLAEAKRFADLPSAVAFWKQQSKRVPLRPDGKPNRPLTAFSVELKEENT